MITKLKLEFGNIKFSATGSEDFVSKARDNFEKKYLKDGIPQASMLDADKTGDSQSSGATDMDLPSYESKLGLTLKSHREDLGEAAGCWLMIEEQKKAFSSAEWRSTMRRGDTFKKTKHGNNSATILKQLVNKDKFIKKTNDQYAVNPKILNDTHSQLKA